jgi:hypothetical protein
MAAKAQAKALTKFTVTQSGDDAYALHIESEGGETLELTATAEQLDLIAETVDTLLAEQGDAADEVDGGDDDELDDDEIEDDEVED